MAYVLCNLESLIAENAKFVDNNKIGQKFGSCVQFLNYLLIYLLKDDFVFSQIMTNGIVNIRNFRNIVLLMLMVIEISPQFDPSTFHEEDILIDSN
jgi:hypothetical protein